MATARYIERRGELEEYFDRTAVETWAKLTSEAPVGSIRATVRAGRDRMRGTLLACLPEDLTGLRILDAGCGTGALAAEAARRGGEVLAVDISPTLVALARERTEVLPGAGSVDFRVGDMGSADLGTFDWVVAMDSLVHYCPEDIVGFLAQLAPRVRAGFAFTFAPSNPLLSLMHTVGKAFPRGNRSPDIVPVAESEVRRRLAAADELRGFCVKRSVRVKSGFYTSHAMELVRS